MVRSMTGFGKGIFEGEELTIQSIVKTTNHKYLNVKLSGIENKELENKAEKIVKDNFSRGRVEVEVKIRGRGPGKDNFPSPSRVKKSFDYLEEITSELNIPESPGLDSLINFGAFQVSGLEKELWEPLRQSLKEAIAEVKEDQKEEGEALRAELEGNLRDIEDLVEKIGSDIQGVVEDYRDRLQSRIEEFINDDRPDKQRELGREVAIFADKVDIEEEIDRIRTHVESARSTLETDEPSGKKLGFIAQELKREANTVSAKCKDGRLQEMAVEMKLEIEKFTEQVRNIE